MTIGIKVNNGVESGSDITSVAYAIRAVQADGVAAGSVDTDDLAPNAGTAGLLESETVTLRVFNLLGEEIATL